MKTRIDLATWNRRDHFRFFSRFEEPFFGVTVEVDCTHAYQKAKAEGRSFFLYYLYRALKAANQTEPFRYRIEDGEVVRFDRVNASPTINRPDGTFGFAYMDFDEDEGVFLANAERIIEEVRSTSGLIPSGSGDNVIHFSALPWLRFTGLSHARPFSFPDSCPKISFGKVTENDGRRNMPVSVTVHHGLMDGYHVGLFLERFQALLDE